MIYRGVHKYARRMYSASLRKSPSSSEIRKMFVDYFIEEHGHTFVRSSPVVPFCDPTVAFVNAGMNQFKSIFLGKEQPMARRVVNSQKCIRVGGKHNDLSVVGKDGYHHTFFEMLGNWSFGDYFKKEACEMAWNLLRGPFGIDTSRLYVTYFGGDEGLSLPADIECREIWRSLGVPDDRILAFGSRDNFWEMGTTGPCGPCTEIHIDHLPNSNPSIRSKLVNAGSPDLTELWNLVFIQYNRKDGGSIETLPEKHIDTGMGMERLVAILQGKSTNYDTDLFLPIFDTIQKISNAPSYGYEFEPSSEKYALDTAYRTLADHSRMITACLADGMLPDQNHKLRRIIRKSMLLSNNVFQRNNLLHEIIPKVSEILGPTYPEMQTKLPNVLEILSHEQEIFTALRRNCNANIKEIISANKHLEEVDLFDSPGFVPAYKELQTLKTHFTKNVMPGDFVFKLKDTYGLDEESIEKLAEVEGLQIDKVGYLKELAKAKDRSKDSFSDAKIIDKASQEISNYTAGLKNTENFYKYNYMYNTSTKLYQVPTIKTKILRILQNGNAEQSVRLNSDNPVTIITEKSNFYHESGGQQSDHGTIVAYVGNSKLQFDVKEVSCSNGCILHSGNFTNSDTKDITLSVNDEVELNVDQNRRTRNIIHHTATHLLNASVRHVIKGVIYQLSSSVTSDCLKLELAILGKKVENELLEIIESLIRHAIKVNAPTSVKRISAQDVLNTKDIVMVPGEIYPETGLRLLALEDPITGLCSKELCCGTHALSTGELQDFCLTNIKQTGRSKYAFTAVAGDAALHARTKSKEIERSIAHFEELINIQQNRADTLQARLQKLRNKIVTSDLELPYLSKVQYLDRVNVLIKHLKDASKVTLKEFVEIEMKNVLQEHPAEKVPFVIHFLKCSTMMEDVSLQKATKLCPDRPVLVVSLTNGMVKARCCVPQDKLSHFSAQEWLEKFATVFNGQTMPPKGQNPREVCNMKAKKVHSPVFHEKLEIAIAEAKKYASKHL
ncbi:unnamed protein product [Hermetia illucens]|uniref:Alanine--tRNA ligase n=1 Tax=Hermetia illucens TaxID=343691 RepID=A0A7R8UKF8_HERIL|nr:alanine--tRNA ligase, mitochondrial [Hermetia illucens]CAD7082279.1 unnamed protein product [Hermetia illucens]